MIKNTISNFSKEKLHSHLKEILIHDVEAAAFLIVAVSLTATLTSFAMDNKNYKTNIVKNIPATNNVNSINKNIYNPQTVQIIDIDQDGFNDMIITHQDGHIEHSFSKN